MNKFIFETRDLYTTDFTIDNFIAVSYNHLNLSSSSSSTLLLLTIGVVATVFRRLFRYR